MVRDPRTGRHRSSRAPFDSPPSRRRGAGPPHFPVGSFFLRIGCANPRGPRGPPATPAKGIQRGAPLTRNSQGGTRPPLPPRGAPLPCHETLCSQCTVIKGKSDHHESSGPGRRGTRMAYGTGKGCGFHQSKQNQGSLAVPADWRLTPSTCGPQATQPGGTPSAPLGGTGADQRGPRQRHINKRTKIASQRLCKVNGR